MTDNPNPENIGYDIRLSMLLTRLKDRGAKVKVRRRKLTHREKDYLHLCAAGNHYDYTTFVKPIITNLFPDAYMTSGGFGPAWPHASDPYMNLTISLEK